MALGRHASGMHSFKCGFMENEKRAFSTGGAEQYFSRDGNFRSFYSEIVVEENRR
jgi:hypothetical protein